jgi:hypothetical protein
VEFYLHFNIRLHGLLLTHEISLFYSVTTVGSVDTPYVYCFLQHVSAHEAIIRYLTFTTTIYKTVHFSQTTGTQRRRKHNHIPTGQQNPLHPVVCHSIATTIQVKVITKVSYIYVNHNMFRPLLVHQVYLCVLRS